MLHYFVNVTGRDHAVRTRYLTTDRRRAAVVARLLAAANRRAAVRALDLTPHQAGVCWYRMGLRDPDLTPPARYRHAYVLGRRTAALRRAALRRAAKGPACA
jgi:hypothetical protein